MGRKFENILGTVGNTPIVRIGKLAPPEANLFVKIEAFNPLGSVKDRLALGVIEEAERSGKLKPGQTVIEATRFGTGGTLKGVARVLAKERPDTKIIVCEPEDAPMLTSGVKQERKADGSPAVGHPAFKPHPMQGWSPDFVPKLTGDAVDMGVIDRILTIASADAMHWSKQLAQKEGIFVGITAGATFAGALRICEEAPRGATVLCMLPDTGERYLSTPLFADIAVDMTNEELGISRSTPSFR